MAPLIVASATEKNTLSGRLESYFTPRRRSFLLHRFIEVGMLALFGLVPAALLTMCIMFAAPLWFGTFVALIFSAVSYLSVALVVGAQHIPGTPDDPDCVYLVRWQRWLIIAFAPLVMAAAMACSIMLITFAVAAFLLMCVFPRETVLAD